MININHWIKCLDKKGDNVENRNFSLLVYVFIDVPIYRL